MGQFEMDGLVSLSLPLSFSKKDKVLSLAVSVGCRAAKLASLLPVWSVQVVFCILPPQTVLDSNGEALPSPDTNVTTHYKSTIKC